MTMRKHLSLSLALGLFATLALAPASHALSAYFQDFEGMTPEQGFPPNDLADDGWLIYGFAWDANPYTGPANLVYQYGSFEAANGAPGSIQGVATDQGGPSQGDLVLSKFSDYNNVEQPLYYIQALTYQEQTVTADDVGTWRFTYDAKIGNLEGESSAFSYIQTLDSVLFFQTGFVSNDTTMLPVEWGTYSLTFRVDESMVGNLLSFGFSATSTNYEGSGVFYDNLRFARVVPIPAAVWLFASALLALRLRVRGTD